MRLQVTNVRLETELAALDARLEAELAALKALLQDVRVERDKVAPSRAAVAPHVAPKPEPVRWSW